MTREQRILVTFYADDETAREFGRRLEVAARAIVCPTEENASALFMLAGEAVYAAAQAKRDREAA